MPREAALSVSSVTSDVNLATPIFGGLVDPVSRLRRRLGIFTNVRVPKKDPVRPQSGAKLIALPEPQLRERAIDRSVATTRLGNQQSGTVLRGMVERWSNDAGDGRERGQRTAIFGAERDLLLERRRLTLQSEVGLHNADAPSDGGSRSLENLGYAFRLSGEEPSGQVSYGVAFDYVGAGFQGDDPAGDDLGLRLNGGWTIDDATRLSGYVGTRTRGLGGDNPDDGWRAGLFLQRTLLPESLPGVTADVGFESSRSGDAAETTAPARMRLRLGLGAELVPGLRGRVAVITESEQDRVTDAERQTNELHLRLERGFTLLGATAQLAGEASLLARSGSDLAHEQASAGLSFTLSDGDDSLVLRGRLLQRDDRHTTEYSGIGGELTARALHLGASYSAGLEAALHDSPADAEPASYRAGLFVNLPF